MRDGGWLRPVVAGVVVVALMAAAVGDAGADHAYRAIDSGIPLHWPKTGAEAQVVVVDSVESTASYDLDLPLRRANARWKNGSDVILSSVEKGSINGRRNCDYIPGKIRVCNYPHGTGAWTGAGNQTQVVGFTQFMYNPDNGHISRAKVRLNDTYLRGTLSGFQYMTDVRARQEVICHELGHALGLQHQPESCLRSRISSNLQPFPDSHDYAQLETSYHVGRGESAAMTAAAHETHGGPKVGQFDVDSHVVSVRDAGNGEKEVTFIRRIAPRAQWGSAGSTHQTSTIAVSDLGLDAQISTEGARSATAAHLAAALPRTQHDDRPLHASVVVGEATLTTTTRAARSIRSLRPLP